MVESAISTRRNIAFTGLIFLAILGFAFIPLANAQDHGCTLEQATDRTNQAEVVLQWSNTHHQCVLISPGTRVTWNGNFGAHPLAGGVSPNRDRGNPISSAESQGGSAVLNDVGDYPYFCEIHKSTMTGVIYVRASLPAEFGKSSPANSSSNQATDPLLSWQSSTGATAYEYCIDNTDNNACNTSWISTGSNTSTNLAGLSEDTDYYWQARAISAGGTNEADNGSWWQFRTLQNPPATFPQRDPTNGATGQSTGVTLNWSASTGAATYEYCVDTTDNNTCDTSWTSTGVNTSTNLAGLSEDTDYYWQARAISAGGTTEADIGSWWSFRTLLNPPANFTKNNPANGATGQSTGTTLNWSASSGAATNEYCIDTTDNNACDTSWISTGSNHSANPAGLTGDSDYFWQTRATNAGGTTEADNGSWWHFRTLQDPPSTFTKINPANGTTGQSTASNLSWSASTGVTEYEYCIDTTDNNTCDSTWVSTGSTTSVNLAGLSKDSDYFWQTRAANTGGTTEADNGNWWHFRTLQEPPAAFTKSGPANGATGQLTETSLVWSASTGATNYEYCIDSLDNNSCDDLWISTGTETSAMLEDLSVLTVYYWQVRAGNGGGNTEANSGTWWNFQTSAIAEKIFKDSFEPRLP